MHRSIALPSFANAARDAGRSLALFDCLEASLSKQPEAIALLASSGSTCTASELLENVRHTAAWIASLGIRRGQRVAYALADGPATAILALAVMSIATAAPLNPRLTEVECQRQLRALRVTTLLSARGTNDDARRAATTLGLRVVELEATFETTGAGLLATPSVDADLTTETAAGVPVDWARADDVLLVAQTSGTTGESKVVPLTHRNVLSMMLANCDVLALTPADRCLGVMPLFHIHGLGAVLCSLLSGGSIVVAEGFTPNVFFECLHRFEPSWYTAVPTIHQTVLAHADSHRALVADVAARRMLRFIRSGSAPMMAGVPGRLMRAFETRYLEACGATECSAYICSNRYGDERIGSVGRPMPDTEIRVVDEHGQPVATGCEGELTVRGPGVFAGYESSGGGLSTSAIVDGFFHTGDLARVDADGFVYLKGRLKEQINRAGMKVAPREVDAALLAHPGVAYAVTFALPDAHVGDEVAAVIVRASSNQEQPSALELQRFAAERLADYKVPRRLIFVDTIPTNAMGKISRIALPRQLGLIMEEPTPAASGTARPEPHTPTELLVAAAWTRVFGRAVHDVDLSFGACGGDSLQAINLSLDLERTLARRIPVAAIPADATIRSLARSLEDDGWRPEPAAPVVLRAAIRTSRPALFCIPGVGGNVHCFAELAGQLADLNHGVIGLPLPGTDGLEPTLATIDAIAERFLATIRERQPNGPYLIAGYSFGGRVGFEICHRLLLANERIAALILIDTPAPSWPPRLRGRARWSMHAGRAWHDGARATIRRLLGRSRNATAEAMLRELALHDAPLERRASQLAMIAAARTATARWRPQPLDVNVIVVRARIPAWTHSDTSDPTMGWSPLVRRPIQLGVVAGSHATLFQSPHVDELAGSIRRVIRAIG